MNDTEQASRFVWLNEALLDRLNRGIPLIIFGAETQFVDNSFKSEAVREQFRGLREKLPGLKVTRLRNLDEVDPLVESGRFNDFVDDVTSGCPRVLFVDERMDGLVSRSCAALAGDDLISRVLLADKLVSAILADAIHVDISKPTEAYVSRDLPPMTPIEDALYREMTALGLNVGCQVTLEPFIADFIISAQGIRLVVEADGAAFHDPENDRIRDQRIKDEYGLETVRFSGSDIFANAENCAKQVQRILEGAASHSVEYAFEGLDFLDPSQRAAVDHLGGDARILAPAGSGKTKVLVNRAIRLLNRGVPPSSILVLAFNKKAALQLEDRLGVLGVPVSKGREGDPGVWVATLNAFGNRVLKSEGVTSKLLDKPWKEKNLVEEAASAIGEHLIGMRGEDPMATLTQEIARVRRGLRSPAEIEVEIPQPSGTRSIALDSLWSAVRDIQKRKNLITFDDQIFLAADLMLREPTIRHLWQKRFKYVLVDEYQDLNAAQIMLMRILTAGPATIFAVGDDDQSIYSWRDANVVNFLDNFKVSYPGMSDYNLEINYRCPKPIVRTSQRLIRKNKRRHPKIIRPAAIAPEGQITISRAEGLMPLGEDLVKFFNDVRRSNGNEWRDMAVLTRTNVQLLAAAVALDRAGIPRDALPRLRLFSTPVAKRLLAYLSIVSDGPYAMKGDDVAEIINRPNRFVKNENADRLRSAKVPWIEINLLTYGCPDKYRSNKELRDFVDDVVKLSRLASSETSTAVDIVDAILDRFKFAVEKDESTKSADDATDEVVLHVIREAARDYLHIQDFIKHATVSAKHELGELEEGPEDKFDEPENEEQRDRVSLNTVHGAKGREWPVVCMFDASRTSSNSKGDGVADEEEERRVFYVGMTRSAGMLHFSYVFGKADPFIGGALLPDELISKEANEAVPWLNKQQVILTRAERELEDGQTAAQNIENEISDLSSGKTVISLENREKELEVMRDDLQTQMVELSRLKPDGFFKRIFKGGKSSAAISREISVIGDRLASLDRQVEDVRRTITSTREQVQELVSGARERLSNQRLSILELEDKLLELNGSLMDVQLAKSHMPLG
jgi:superfamily I DNA/RNA helicase/very-short-patch-repair endonuclease